MKHCYSRSPLRRNTYNIGGGWRIIRRVEPGHLVLEDRGSARFHCAVVLDALQPEPHSIAAVEARVSAFAKQVRDEAVTKAATVSEDDQTRIIKASGYEQKTA